MNAIQSYEKVLGTLAAEARVGHAGRGVRGVEERRDRGDARPPRAWINGREVGGPNPRFAHLHRGYE
jgi:hypothetical protein